MIKYKKYTYTLYMIAHMVNTEKKNSIIIRIYYVDT